MQFLHALGGLLFILKSTVLLLTTVLRLSIGSLAAPFNSRSQIFRNFLGRRSTGIDQEKSEKSLKLDKVQVRSSYSPMCRW